MSNSLLNGAKSVEIQANKFMDVHGNTYHAVSVTVTYKNGETVTRVSDRKYGYGRDYMATANELVTGEYTSQYLKRSALRKAGIDCVEVDRGYGRKKDLFRF
jgi:hypothetical protein